jgi:hypothetical protein
MYCDICCDKKTNNLFIFKKCCFSSNICIECYLKYDKRKCMSCKQIIDYKDVDIHPKLFFEKILKKELPRCPCIVKNGNRRGLQCLGIIYPPFNTCVKHMSSSNKNNYKNKSSYALSYIIYDIKFNFKIIDSFFLTKFYYLYSQKSNKNIDYISNRRYIGLTFLLPNMDEKGCINKNTLFSQIKEDNLTKKLFNNLSLINK